MTKRASFRVFGLDCAEEVAILRRAVGTQAGVLDLDFDILNSRMSVAYAPDRITPEAIIAVVARSGMSAVAWEER